MSKRTTITLSEEVKRRLERLKGRRSWDDFLSHLLDDYLRLRRVVAAMKLEELGFPEVEAKEVRSRWRFRDVEF